MEHQIGRVSKKVVSGISIIVIVGVIFLFDHYYYNADVLPQLSKWPRLGILMLAAVMLSSLITAVLVKTWSAFLCKKSSVK